MKNKPIFGLIVAGLLFSGYLSAIKLFTHTCAFNEGCPYFLGYPACWYGFGMYLTMFVTALLAYFQQASERGALKTYLGVSALGILFAGSFVVQEIAQSQVTGTLGLSTCAYGLIFYVLIFIFSLSVLRKGQVGN